MADKHLPYTRKPVQKRTAGIRRRPRRRNPLPLAAAGIAFCLLVIICSGTYSYFSAKDHVVNQLDLAELDFAIEEPSWQNPDTPVRPGDVLPKDPQIVNTGNIDFVVRVKIQEVWKPKKPDSGLSPMENPNYVRFFASNKNNFSSQQLLDILQRDRQMEETQKNFALRLNLIPNKTNPNTAYWDPQIPQGWYRGKSKNSEWLYYNQVVPAAGRTSSVFQAVTIRTAEDVWPIEAVTPSADETLDQAHARALAAYNKRLSLYDLDIYVYAETVQADAWKSVWADDLPVGWETRWGGGKA